MNAVGDIPNPMTPSPALLETTVRLVILGVSLIAAMIVSAVPHNPKPISVSFVPLETR